MIKESVLQAIQKIARPVFTTNEIATLRHGSLSSTSQTLSRFASQNIVGKVTRGVWCLPAHPYFSPFAVVPFLTPSQRVYVSFISALHLHGLIEQIPQIIYVSTTGHTRVIRTTIGSYSFHQLSPQLFTGFDWYGKRQDFLIASAEKALIDSLYLSSRRGKRFGIFPELHFSHKFSFQRAAKWGKMIPDKRIRGHVLKKLEEIKINAVH
jgi:predicted transcriptional regulator of viral defense system